MRLWRIRLQPPRYLPLYKYEILSRKKSVLMCMKFYQKKSSKFKKHLKSIWEFVIVLSGFLRYTYYDFDEKPILLLQLSMLLSWVFQYDCLYDIKILSTLSSPPSEVLPARKSDHIQCTGKKQYWNSKLMDFFCQVWHISDSEANIIGPTSGNPLQGDK